MIYLEFIFQFKAFVVSQHQTSYSKRCQTLTLLFLGHKLQPEKIYSFAL